VTGYEENVRRFTGFAGDYDRYRYRPPAILADLLCRYAGVVRPALVADLGCGTGISTRYWADRADRVVGVDPAPDMLDRARAVSTAGNVELRAGHGHDTGLDDGAADIVACSQSFHWMEPASTLAEVGRVLRPGGVFAAYDYKSASATGLAELDEAVVATSRRIYRLDLEHNLKKDARFHPKAGHEQALRESGVFRMTRELLLHSEERTTAERLIGGFTTLGALQILRGKGISDEDLGVADLVETARRLLGDGEIPIVVSYVVHLGVVAD